jgi:hypothetical protein
VFWFVGLFHFSFIAAHRVFLYIALICDSPPFLVAVAPLPFPLSIPTSSLFIVDCLQTSSSTRKSNSTFLFRAFFIACVSLLSCATLRSFFVCFCVFQSCHSAEPQFLFDCSLTVALSIGFFFLRGVVDRVCVSGSALFLFSFIVLPCPFFFFFFPV